MTSSLYNRYEKSTITKFDIIGSYFVGIYYNELYLKADQLRNEGKYNSLTQSYQQVLYNYIQFTQHKDFFRKTILGIHNYFISTTKYVSMTHKECIDFIVSEFIPNHLFENIKETQKYNILNNILIDCLKIFTEKILQSYIVHIIDNHYEQANINILQNCYLEIILLEKDKMYAKFINPEKRNHSIPSELYNNIQKQLVYLQETNNKLKKINQNLIKENEDIKNIAETEIDKLKKMGIQVIQKNKELEEQLNYYKNIANNIPKIETVNTNTQTECIDDNIANIPIEVQQEDLSLTTQTESHQEDLSLDIQNEAPQQEYSNNGTQTMSNNYQINTEDTNTNIVKEELDNKQTEILKELNDDDIMDDFTNFGNTDINEFPRFT